ncbi:MAG: FliH/SctL family protein, partial [Alphaproteobacteria bacterium]|nr:FliH/SctL family protein [Alphaproteobacteria bacterium]
EAAGRAAARQEIAQTLNHNLQNLAENITQLLAEREQQISHFGSEAGKIAAAMVGKLFPELARRGGATEIEALLHSSIELARERPRLTVSLAPHLQSLLEEKLRDLAKAQGFEGHLTFIADGAMGDSDVRMEWSDGGIERLAARTWQNISDLLVRLDQAHAHG